MTVSKPVVVATAPFLFSSGTTYRIKLMLISALRDMFPRSHNKENKDTVQDVLLLLYLLDKAKNKISGKDPLNAKIKLLKLVFLAEKEMVDNKFKGFNFFFNVYKMGPSSKELLRMIDDLRTQNLIVFDKKHNAFVATEKAKEMVEDFTSSVGENEPFFNVIDQTIEKFGSLSPEQILDVVYSMEITPMYSQEVVNIGEAVRNSPKKRLLMKMDSSEVKKELSVPEDWIETVNFLMNPEFV